ncbi:hypothetical protein GCM10011500_01110 [Mucilaginibacter rubeus]|nr:hypothetical protein GCM10011500_01110 [Mucilaginibacter rubeus]
MGKTNNIFMILSNYTKIKNMATKELDKEKTDASKQLRDLKSSKQEKTKTAKALSENKMKRKPLL